MFAPGTLFSHIFHASPIAMTINALADGRYVDVNDSYVRLIGFSREEMIGRRAVDLGILSRRQRESVVQNLLQSRGLANDPQGLRPPSGPVPRAIFLPGTGPIAFGSHRYKVRCVEEYHAWRFALDQMAEHGITVTPRVRARVAESLEYAVAKARRRGLRAVPAEVEACIAEQRELLNRVGNHPEIHASIIRTFVLIVK